VRARLRHFPRVRSKFWESALSHLDAFPKGLWSRALSHEFLPWIQARGEEYLRRGAVQITDVGHDTVTAVVLGGDHYTVRLRVRDGELDLSCTCAYFVRNGDGCKHAWATLLVAEQGGYLPPPPPSPDARRPPARSGALALVHGTTETPRRNTDWLAPLLRSSHPSPDAGTRSREMGYVVDATASHGGLVLEIVHRQRRANGEWAAWKPHRLRREVLPSLTDPDDRAIASLLLGARDEAGWDPYYGRDGSTRFRLDDPLARLVVPLVCRSGRGRLRAGGRTESTPLRFDEGGSWELTARVTRQGDDYRVEGTLIRDAGERRLDEAVLLSPSGFVFFPDSVCSFEAPAGFGWVNALRRGPRLLPAVEASRFLVALAASPGPLRVDLPEELRYSEERVAPRAALRLVAPTNPWEEALHCEVSFDYGGTSVPGDSPGYAVWREAERQIVRRDHEAELAAFERLRLLGVRRTGGARTGSPAGLALAPSRLPATVRALIAEGWQVEAEGSLYRPGGAVHLRVSSGVDWFDLDGTAQFGDQRVPLPRLLSALRKGTRTITLDDGTVGMIPEEWAARYGLLAEMIPDQGDLVRFTAAQVGVLDALLAAQPQVDVDEVFRAARERLLGFAGVEPRPAPPGFKGRLRGYQQAGLGWLFFLRDLGFGGCLADDMGLGKTIQLLALLQSVRAARSDDAASRGHLDSHSPPPLQSPSAPGGLRGRQRPGSSSPLDPRRPWLVVVPRSLIFNWKAEAARFTPGLRVLDHTGVGRVRSAAALADADLVLTTYGTLRRDALLLRDVLFDTVVLDEAQAVKNPGTEAAKAARLLKAEHRLALSGTPIENHLGELMSLFEFLNPGMLGRWGTLRPGAELDEDARKVLAQALRPFILRRTKEQVIRDLPAKTEQTLLCEMESEQRSLYDELRAHYRETLLARVERDGLARSRMHVLEALLRLRQAACHPGLVDRKRKGTPSAKIDALLPALLEVVSEGHKALVFSQFTSFLALVRERLDAAGIVYETLDGRTRDRQARVDRFQGDASCPVFLVSLKAGGLGLNLTAADYVFLLDPWWNPAVEAQAVDRAHRLGQRRPVFAYRLIAKDTVEEKIVELQAKKRELADALITADGGVLRKLRREDLELLLS
jgi:superfamily II DNA or RNA helicase